MAMCHRVGRASLAAIAPLSLGQGVRFGAVTLLGDEEIGAKLEKLSGWTRAGDAIAKEFSCGDFVGSVKFVDSLVGPAEEMGHHPDLELSWDKVTVTISTHSEGGLTAADFELAARVDALSPTS